MPPARFAIECSDTFVRAAHPSGAASPEVKRVELPAGTLERGAVKDPEALQKALKQLEIPEGTACTLLLPPACVYATRLEVTRAQGQRMRDAVAEATEKLIPEPVTELTLRWKKLARAGGTVTLAPAADIKHVSGTLADMLAEYAKRDLHPAAITVAAGDAHLRIIQKALPEHPEHPIAVAALAGYESDADLSPGLFAALRARRGVPLDLLRKPASPRTRFLLELAGLAAAVLAFAMALQYRM